MSDSNSSRDITDYLRGLAIILVMVTHYAGTYDYDFYASYLFNYGNAFMAIFFILGGYGAYYSAEKRFVENRSTHSVIGRYYLDRVLRIYPLYWAALIPTAILQPDLFPAGDASVSHILAVVVAFPFVTTPFWFIPSIIQCYIFAPLLYLILKKLGTRNFVFFNVALLAVLLAFTEWYRDLIILLRQTVSVPDPTTAQFRGIFLGNVLLFSMGLMLPSLVRMYEAKMKGWLPVTASVLVLLESSYILKYDVLVLKQDVMLIEMAYFFSVFFFCWTMIALRPRLPQTGVMTLIGRDSYSLYLFHALLFQLLMLVHLFQEPVLLSLAIVLAIFPALLWFCAYSEKGSRAFRLRIWRVGERVFAAGSSDGG